MRSKLWEIGPAAVILTVAAILATIWSNGTNNSAACASRTHAPVPAAAKKALAAYAGLIMHEVASGEGSRDEVWFDPVSGRSRQLSFSARRGGFTVEFVSIIHGGVEDRFVVSYRAHADMRARTWAHDTHRLAVPFERRNVAAELAQSWRDLVAIGAVSIVGRDTIDGHRVLSLSGRTWVDPLTYLPKRQQHVFGNTYWTWLPRTPANVAKTRLVIPDGFERVAAPRSDFEYYESPADWPVACQA